MLIAHLLIRFRLYPRDDNDRKYSLYNTVASYAISYIGCNRPSSKHTKDENTCSNLVQFSTSELLRNPHHTIFGFIGRVFGLRRLIRSFLPSF